MYAFDLVLSVTHSFGSCGLTLYSCIIVLWMIWLSLSAIHTLGNGQVIVVWSSSEILYFDIVEAVNGLYRGYKHSLGMIKTLTHFFINRL